MSRRVSAPLGWGHPAGLGRKARSGGRPHNQSSQSAWGPAEPACGPHPLAERRGKKREAQDSSCHPRAPLLPRRDLLSPPQRTPSPSEGKGPRPHPKEQCGGYPPRASTWPMGGEAVSWGGGQHRGKIPLPVPCASGAERALCPHAQGPSPCRPQEPVHPPAPGTESPSTAPTVQAWHGLSLGPQDTPRTSRGWGDTAALPPQ